MSYAFTDTIAAIATAPGRGGVGIIRISGPLCSSLIKKLINKPLSPRHALYGPFLDRQNTIIDSGIALFFEGPHSFTGEDVLELQAHGGPVVLDLILAEVLSLGARQARPGEFSERAYLNDKLDLAQAEAIADLINASSVQAAKQAVNSLQGAFSKKIEQLVEQLIRLRVYVESAIDFPEEEIDFLSDGHVQTQLNHTIDYAQQVLSEANQGVLTSEGMKVVIAGRPNAGKSSLLNALASSDIAIVTDIAGTTRDVLREQIHIDGMPLHIIDTAGLRESNDQVEQIGIERAWKEIHQADRILLVVDTTDSTQIDVRAHWTVFFSDPRLQDKITVIFNKIDQSQWIANTSLDFTALDVSAKNNTGLSDLKSHLKQVMGYQSTAEGGFSARRRHIDAIERAIESMNNGMSQLTTYAAGELLAEDLRMAQQHCNEITGTFTADDLLGEIFTSFCIGK